MCPISKPQDQPHFHLLAFVALILGACAIGLAPIFVRVSPVGPTATAFWRVLLACPLFLAVAFVTRKHTAGRAHLAVPRGRDGWFLIVPGLCFAGDMAFWHRSLNDTTVANATLLTNMAPIFVTLMAWLFFRERVTGRFVAGLVAALLGAVLLLGDSLQISPANFRGDLLGLFSAVWYGSYQLTAKGARRRFTTPLLMASVAASAAVALYVFARLTGEPLLWESDMPLRGWTVLLGLALVSHVCGQGFIVYALAHLPAGFASTSLLVQPLVAALTAWLLLGEGIGPWQFLGGTVILLGIFVVQRATFGGGRKRN